MKEYTNDVCGMRRVGRQRRRGVSGGVNKFVWWLPKRKDLLRNGYKEEIWLHMIDTEYRKLL